MEYQKLHKIEAAKIIAQNHTSRNNGTALYQAITYFKNLKEKDAFLFFSDNPNLTLSKKLQKANKRYTASNFSNERGKLPSTENFMRILFPFTNMAISEETVNSDVFTDRINHDIRLLRFSEIVENLGYPSILPHSKYFVITKSIINNKAGSLLFSPSNSELSVNYLVESYNNKYGHLFLNMTINEFIRQLTMSTNEPLEINGKFIERKTSFYLESTSVKLFRAFNAIAFATFGKIKSTLGLKDIYPLYLIRLLTNYFNCQFIENGIVNLFLTKSKLDIKNKKVFFNQDIYVTDKEENKRVDKIVKYTKRFGIRGINVPVTDNIAKMFAIIEDILYIKPPLKLLWLPNFKEAVKIVNTLYVDILNFVKNDIKNNPPFEDPHSNKLFYQSLVEDERDALDIVINNIKKEDANSFILFDSNNIPILLICIEGYYSKELDNFTSRNYCYYPRDMFIYHKDTKGTLNFYRSKLKNYLVDFLINYFKGN